MLATWQGTGFLSFLNQLAAQLHLNWFGKPGKQKADSAWPAPNPDDIHKTGQQD